MGGFALDFFEVFFAHQEDVVGDEGHFLFFEEAALVFGGAFFESFLHAFGGDFVDVFGDAGEGFGIDLDGDFFFAVDIGDGADEAVHVVKVFVDRAILFGDGTGGDADAVAFFEFCH